MHEEKLENRILSPEEIKASVKQEREWLRENNAVSAVTDGPVEDMEGVPLPADMFQGFPPAHSEPVPSTAKK
jgi:hypothetical protein